MGVCAVGKALNHRCAMTGTRALCSPLRCGIHRQEVIAINPQRGETIALAFEGKSRRFTGSDALESRDRPLIVDDVENSRRLVSRGQDQRAMEIAFSA